MRIVEALRVTQRIINNKQRKRWRMEQRAKQVSTRMANISGHRLVPERNLGRAILKGT